MAKAFGIVASSSPSIKVEGMQDYRPIGAFSFLGRYRIIDFPISNMSNSGIDHIHVYVGKNPRSLVEHLGSGRIYNINSKRGKLQMLFPEGSSVNEIYNTDIAAYMENLAIIKRMHEEYVVITPAYMVYSQNYADLLQEHIDSGADISLLYHRVDNAKDAYLNCQIVELNHQKGVDAPLERNIGKAKNRDISMDTYVMKTSLFIDLVQKAAKESSMYTLVDAINAAIEAGELDIRGIAHHGYFAAITDFKSYYDANLALLDRKEAESLFRPDWRIYTRTTDSCPTTYFPGSEVENSMVSNGCLIDGTVENSVIGRGVKIGKGAVVKNSVVLSYAEIGPDVHLEGQVVDKWAKVIHATDIVAAADKPGYIRRSDKL